MILPRTFGSLAIALAVGNLALMAVAGILSDALLGLVLPLVLSPTPELAFPLGHVFWVLLIATACCAVVALAARQWRAGAGALVLIAISLLPSAGVLFECSQGNCI